MLATKIRRTTLGVLAAVLVALSATTGATPASAASNGAWAVTPTPSKKSGPTAPAYFYLDAPAGTTLKESVRVSNLTKVPLTLELYGADGYNTERDGGFALKNIDDTQDDIGKWVSIDAGRLTIPPRKRADIPFTVKIPENATPGDHVGGIVALGPPGEAVEGSAVQVRKAVGARIYLRVAGEINPGLSVSDMEVDKQNPLLPKKTSAPTDFTLSNVGNIHLTPSVSVTAKGMFGHALTTEDMPALDMLPGDQTILSSKIGGLWPLDYATITATAKTEDGIVAEHTAHVIMIPWTTLVVLLLVAGGVGYWMVRRRRARQAASPIVLARPDGPPARHAAESEEVR